MSEKKIVSNNESNKILDLFQLYFKLHLIRNMVPIKN